MSRSSHNVRKKGLIIHFAMLVIAAMVLSACAETQLIIHTAKRANKQETGKVTYKVGNPYQIGETWYYPHVNYDYDETGIASWYGPNFHGKLTANGEIYDMNDLTAAHRTLPLPTWVVVTNLDNGRKLKLRVNDRGPYAKGRIIDISRRGSQLLGFQDQGTARVRVEVLVDESRELAARLQGDALLSEAGSPITVEKLPTKAVDAETLAPPPGANVANGSVEAESIEIASTQPTVPISDVDAQGALQADDTVQTVAIGDTQIFVQAGAFSQFENANRAQAILSVVGDVKISQILINDMDLFRVRLGPVANVSEADMLLERVVAAGYSEARIIVD